jgi:hypothetical protein
VCVCVCVCVDRRKREGKSSKRHKVHCGPQALALGPISLRPGSLAA